jgi:uncharacterized protein HemX
MWFNQSSSRSQHRAPLWIVPVLGSLFMLPILPKIFDAPNFPTQQSQLRPIVEEPTSNTDQTIAAGAIAALGLGILGLSWKSMHRSSSAATTRSGHTAASSGRSANRSLQRQLHSLLHNDYQAAERLVSQTQAKHPDRSIDWCIEKAIYDLQRDRH